MTAKLFTNLETPDPRTLAEQELAELSDWSRRLGNGDFEFTSEQRAVIEKLFAPRDRAEIERLMKDAWYSAARAAIPMRIESLRDFLGLGGVNEALGE